MLLYLCAHSSLPETLQTLHSAPDCIPFSIFLYNFLLSLPSYVRHLFFVSSLHPQDVTVGWLENVWHRTGNQSSCQSPTLVRMHLLTHISSHTHHHPAPFSPPCIIHRASFKVCCVFVFTLAVLPSFPHTSPCSSNLHLLLFYFLLWLPPPTLHLLLLIVCIHPSSKDSHFSFTFIDSNSAQLDHLQCRQWENYKGHFNVFKEGFVFLNGQSPFLFYI